MKCDLNKTLACLVSLALAVPGSAAAAARALAPLPVLKAVEARVPSLPPPLPALPRVAPLLPVLSHERPADALVPRVFEASTLDTAAYAPAAPVRALGMPGLRPSMLHGGSPRAGSAGGPGAPRDPDKEISALKKALLVSGALIGVELAGALTLESLALRADALHLTADWALNAVALGAMIVARRGGRARWPKLEPAVGLASSLVIGYTAVEIAREALARLASPEPFSAPLAIVLALCGLAANGLATAILYKHRGGGLGVRSVFLHALTDAAGSLSVAVSSALIWAFGWAWADPLASALIVLLISKTAFELARDSWKALRAPR